MSGGVGEGGRRKFLIFFFFFTFHYPFTCLYFCSLKICRNNTNEYSNIIWSIKNKLHKSKNLNTQSLFSVIHPSLFVLCFSPFNLHFSSFILHPSTCTLHSLFFIPQPTLLIYYFLLSSLILQPSPLILFILRPSLLIFFSPIFILYPSLLTLFFLLLHPNP